MAPSVGRRVVTDEQRACTVNRERDRIGQRSPGEDQRRSSGQISFSIPSQLDDASDTCTTTGGRVADEEISISIQRERLRGGQDERSGGNRAADTIHDGDNLIVVGIRYIDCAVLGNGDGLWGVEARPYVLLGIDHD